MNDLSPITNDLSPITTLLGAAAAGYVAYRLLRPTPPALPRMAPVTMRETVAALSSPRSVAFLAECLERSGPVFRLPMPLLSHYVVVTDPKVARSVAEDVDNCKPDFMYQVGEVVTGGVTTIVSARDHAVGSKWHAARKSAAKAFHPAHVQAMNHTCGKCYSHWLDEALAPAARDAHPIDVCHELLVTTLQFICEAGFAFEMPAEEARTVLADISTSLEVAFRIFAMVPLSRTFWWAFPQGRDCMAASERCIRLARTMLERYRNLPPERKAKLAGTLVASIDGNTAYASDEERWAEILIFLIAGHDTTAMTVAWALSDLAHAPEVQAELRAELRSMPPAERSKSPLLAAVIKESMRLNPVVAGGTLRKLAKDLLLADGTTIPKGAIVHMPFGLIFRAPQVGEAPDEFRPERWLTSRSDLAPGLADVFPFSLGRRSCVGQVLALAELYTVLPMLLADFDWTVVASPRAALFLTNKPEGLKLRATPVE